MNYKKVFAATAVCVLLVGTLTVPAFARGGHRGGQHGGRRNPAYATCSLANCHLTTKHVHDGISYCGRTPCPVDDCTETGVHTHDDVHYYACATPGTGCGTGLGAGCGRRGRFCQNRGA
ncbi:MAG: hypothetical protein RR452_08005 [Clostridia bacterium]